MAHVLGIESPLEGERRLDAIAAAIDGAPVDRDYTQFLTQKNQELAAILHQLGLATTQHEVDGYLAQAQHIYTEIVDSINELNPRNPLDLPDDVLTLSEEQVQFLSGVLQAESFEGRAVIQELVHNFGALPSFAVERAEMRVAPSILDPSKSLGRTAIDLMTQFDDHHERRILDNIERTRERNRQLSSIQEMLSSLYEMRAQGGDIDREGFDQKYNEARDLLAAFTADMEDIRDYVDLPELGDDFVPTEEGIRSFSQKLELMKIRVQGSISDLANDMHKFVQVYTIIIDIMKNMLEMDRNEREAIVRRTGQ